ncbi:GNAT family N-acetyltransferase [Pseudomonas guariconensis]|uniref:GNAT family N-acetyltransferase n=1 Tax=Pseudomonas guariconensis TaxID=1288410 RepID=UPI0025A9B127|nr:GNAT family N-acetyltransferase [Pseudomonas guariconensis]MDM9593359.1 GNAT family N-acetyltransferase [Pseudomonas guariconensis]MDM9606186.1 GNAT family N-acetyltransferase [Pseudomonas guariconensis]MDM9611143.1 GNAT family N-acetyltransferase [Pseudomonas guariconensis]
MPLRSVAACQSRVVEVQRLAETRALPEHPQRKKGGGSVFGKWTTRKRGNLIFSTVSEHLEEAVQTGELVGFLMHALDPDENSRWIYRLMIDRNHQGRGYGRAALRALMAHLHSLPGGPSVALGVDPENVGARRLYGEVIDGELIMRRMST